MPRSVLPTSRLEGSITLPSDKSIAHRAALFAAFSVGQSTIHNYPASADPQSTLACLRQLGVPIDQASEHDVVITGVGKNGLEPPRIPLDCGNSGTTMRLLSGILAGMRFPTILTGDHSLTQRPMGRIARPLSTMGARIALTDGHPPIYIHPPDHLKGITYPLPIPSAQVKSCILLAGLWAKGTTTVIEPSPSRDHTERMLGLPIQVIAGTRHITSNPDICPAGHSHTLPGDFSAAAFFLVATSIVQSGHVYLPGVGLNPTRTGLLDTLRAMGAQIEITNQRLSGGEPVGDLTVQSARLHGINIGGDQIPGLIDEVPILAVAAACASGRTIIRDAAELRVKECDRIHAMALNLRLLGAQVEEFDDGLAITGGYSLTGTNVGSFHDHRIAMAMGIAGLVASGRTTIHGAEVASVSFPGYWDALASLV